MPSPSLIKKISVIAATSLLLEEKVAPVRTLVPDVVKTVLIR